MKKLIPKRINEFFSYKFKDDLLWEASNDNFAGVTEEDPEAMSLDALSSLHSRLKLHVIRIQRDRKASIAQSLYQTEIENKTQRTGSQGN